MLEDVCKQIFRMPVEVTYIDTALDSVSTYAIEIDPKDHFSTAEIVAIQEAMETIFHAIGKNKGRTIFITLWKNNENSSGHSRRAAALPRSK